MQSISGIIYLILGACLLPYAFTFIAKKAAGFKSSDNQHPREVLAKSTGRAVLMLFSKTVLKAFRYLLRLF